MKSLSLILLLLCVLPGCTFSTHHYHMKPVPEGTRLEVDHDDSRMRAWRSTYPKRYPR